MEEKKHNLKKYILMLAKPFWLFGNHRQSLTFLVMNKIKVHMQVLTTNVPLAAHLGIISSPQGHLGPNDSSSLTHEKHS